MVQLLGLVLISFVITGILLVPFIDLLFHLKRKYQKKTEGDEKTESTDVPITNQLMKGDEDTPSGGGILLVLILIVIANLLAFFVPNFDQKTLQVLTVTLVAFGGLGLVDDIKWITTKRKGKLLGLGRKVQFIIQLVFGLLIGWMLYTNIGLYNLNIPVIANINLGWLYVPFAAFTIVSFANAYNISDGLDGLSTGLLTICLFAFLALASTNLDITLAAFIGIWIGLLLAYLYFNVWPARIFLGDAGAFGFGATLAVVGLLTGKIVGLTFIGAVYIIIVASSLLQILSKRFLHRKLLPVAPLHMYFKYIGWEEPKIVARFWLAGAIFAIFGLWLALLSG
jgi:phospho-N-acetylmuramoyl-pentapeptide-transferase